MFANVSYLSINSFWSGDFQKGKCQTVLTQTRLSQYIYIIYSVCVCGVGRGGGWDGGVGVCVVGCVEGVWRGGGGDCLFRLKWVNA